MDLIAERRGCSVLEYFKQNVASAIDLTNQKRVVISVKPAHLIEPFLRISSEHIPEVLYSAPIDEDEFTPEFAAFYEQRYGDRSQPFLMVNAFVDADNFEDAMVEQQRSVEQLLVVMKQLLTTVNTIHEAGYCHGDLITYDNVLVDQYLHVTVMDIEGIKSRSYNNECAAHDLRSVCQIILQAILPYRSSDTDERYYELRDDIEMRKNVSSSWRALIGYYPDYTKIIELCIKLLETSSLVVLDAISLLVELL